MRRLALPSSLLLAVAVPFAARAQAPKPTPVADDFVSARPAQPAPPPLAAALAGVKAPALAAHVAFLASPALEGRGLGRRGLDAAAEYAAATLALAGIPPLAGGSYFQPVPVREISGLAGELTVERTFPGGTSSRAFSSGVDCILPEIAPGALSASVVFAAYGIREPKLRDDYEGLDVRGKVVLVLSGAPDGAEWRTPKMVEKYAAAEARERWAAKLETARTLGAVALLAVEAGDFPSGVLAKEAPQAAFFLPFEAGANAAPPLVRVSRAVADALLAGADPAARPALRALPGTTVTLRTTGTERAVVSRNVIAVLAGADPKLRDEAVVIGAHMDHLGKVGDTVYPGADDNASGVAALLEIAKAFAAAPQPPQRTVVFAFWTGEEEGKFGSGWWVRHPLWPLERTTAYLNLDMIGHPWLAEEIKKLVTDSRLPDGEAFLAGVEPADFVEPGLPLDAPELAAALRRAAGMTGLALHLDRTDGTHGGSDYRAFARAGVPFVRFFGNFFPAYHEPGDTADKLDASQVQRVARLALATAWLLADR
ncbi:MAG: M20/M25/M40 family metallo-hydrolase [Thermoanaerobaculaceae bacterium]|nr:M20/M25/M40 family metallo-hydrolase [Thermoanaerobaculaceae bacterium]